MGAEPRPSPTIEVSGPEEGDDSWSVTSYDLAATLGARDNHEAQEIVLGAVAQADPALLGRLDFDSESGMFEVRCDTEGDARTAVDLIASVVPK